MIKTLHLFSIFFILSLNTTKANDNDSAIVVKKVVVNGYYQTIDLDANTPCGCDSKTDRTYQLSKGILDHDLMDYKLYAYRFTFGSSTNAYLKLFKSFENDPNVYKLSMKKWDSFMLLTTVDFDKNSFESAANIAFQKIIPITIEEFLKEKNTGIYNIYLQQQQQQKPEEFSTPK